MILFLMFPMKYWIRTQISILLNPMSSTKTSSRIVTSSIKWWANSKRKISNKSTRRKNRSILIFLRTRTNSVNPMFIPTQICENFINTLFQLFDSLSIKYINVIFITIYQIPWIIFIHGDFAFWCLFLHWLWGLLSCHSPWRIACNVGW